MASTVINTARDPNTLCNYNNWRTTHTSATFDILFSDQKLQGTVVHTLRSITNFETAEIIFDSSHVEVSSVKVDDQKVDFEFLPRVEPYGSPLKIQLSKAVPMNGMVTVAMDVSTTASCTALQWLTPAQTPNKKHPYLFSQCQAIHARSIFPCQDTPDVKATFDFAITSPLPVVASGLADETNPKPNSSSTSPNLYKFHQPIPIPSYLFAIASGDIAFAPIGPRSVVATGPDELAACKWEFENDTENFLQVAESLVYPYPWGQYNVLVLPPSFPYGGMENPQFTFATPSVVSGDRENVDVICHELSHSWSGNLVSNASWEHFWLNEGWTMYLERRIEVIIHKDAAYRDFSAILGWKALVDSIERFGETSEYTKLVIDLKGGDPDEAFSNVPYEKGFIFLYYIEKLVGQIEFDKFIPHYFEKFRGKSLDSYEFKATMLDFFAPNEEVSARLETLDWDLWFYKPGYPPVIPKYDTKLADVAYRLAEKWEILAANPDDKSFVPSQTDLEGWTSTQVAVFLERVMLYSRPLPAAHAAYMGDVYGFKKSQNLELSTRYAELAMIAGDTSIKPRVVELLGQTGRMKFVQPLFRHLIVADVDLAAATFEANKDFYHPICRQMVARMLFGTKSK